MKTNCFSPLLNIKSFQDFIKMNKDQQGRLLNEQGVLLDFDTKEGLTTRLYYLQGFFVEEVFCREQNEVIEITPFKQGYRLERFLKEQSCSLSERPLYFQFCIN